MAPTRPPPPPNNIKKRKEAPTDPQTNASKRYKPTDHRQKTRDARTLSTQTSSKAFKNGELDVSAFVKSRAFEISALEEGMARSKKALNRRAFQQVPKELRRRTASHNVKRVPKRLRERGKREMADDNTPTVTARRRKPTAHMRLRLETVKKLRALGAKRKAGMDRVKVTVADPNGAPPTKSTDSAKDKQQPAESTTAIKARTPKIKKSLLATPPVPKAKFRKRQIHKSWLPTHLFHAKRARMTAPSAALWRFSVPLTPTAKSYRPTHRASHERGAVAWDMSYIATVQLEGREGSLIGMLKVLGVAEEELIGRKGEKWRQGRRALENFVYEREAPHDPVAPVTIIWCVSAAEESAGMAGKEKRNRKLLLRVHPSAFYQLWEELLRLAKVAKPAVSVEDLRFDIGSLEITGPGGTEALLSALWPSRTTSEPLAVRDSASTAMDIDSESRNKNTIVEETWSSLAGLTNPAMVPKNALLAFNVQDPRLHHPPRTIKLPKTDAEQHKLLELIASWPVDAAQQPPELFDRKARQAASATMPSQKAVNRRKGLAAPGQYPEPLPKDPQIPVLLYTTAPSTTDKGASGRPPPNSSSWTLLTPWKCMQPIWYSLMYYPLSTGQQPRFGGLDQYRQLSFEAGKAWFPGDFPGTKAGWEWEYAERRKREAEWRRRPKGKRVSFERVEVGEGVRGEIGIGWGCDWERLIGGALVASEGEEAAMNVEKAAESGDKSAENGKTKAQEEPKEPPQQAPSKPPHLTQLSARQALALLATPPATPPATTTVKLPPHIHLPSALTTVRLTLLTRGVPQPCARIYRLPSSTANPELRRQWLALLPTDTHKPTQKRGGKHALPRGLPSTGEIPPHVVQQRLAQSLLEPVRAGEEGYPSCPGEGDLVGFVTAGSYDLAAGFGTGIGSLLVEKVMGREEEAGERHLCVVRNSGTGVARLGRWEVI
ncbi:Ribonucleases P/MRP protein subunit pop1 [Friedmanniomyces endolithicus]|uniref:Ribonucleases P/MRP protein subunit pop1 n=1 Tax=Friedmanniomyces endolithicus TaxID=329885 RepID=A0AAN6FXJ8_9PEZI|nr:Ribonucleases P/MRP protein subunit pop1 [Friedmanniomyces endolithicus]KAK0288165.1 Ribonucleases P/MRP protein subunit pop1 [Friedmanniomyces endolithicus]KAK0326296.1 Ribonucleases P/MRP protein subunit pop1 [Friedmanniomyces endolithicus]KAK0903623.1 Ribonucleases P/MRP protein subunit pop1 [Friedmanniomyces endolithicus]KAK0954176.1 Ribonucleases P/MRP protein subunit pop1 [Friedmanniomyces endolithicus]